MSDITIVLGNKNYSSWSLRGWLPLVQSGLPFQEIVIPLRQPDTARLIAQHSPSGKVPVLKAGDLTVWDSQAIGEYLAERVPAAGLWPADPASRAVARAVAAEMHSGFAALRQRMPMDLRSDFPGYDTGAAAAADIARILEIWTHCRATFGAGGDFLFGSFSLADAAYAPVVARLVTYHVPLEGAAARYRDAVMAHPAMVAWRAAALAEPWVIEHPERDSPPSR